MMRRERRRRRQPADEVPPERRQDRPDTVGAWLKARVAAREAGIKAKEFLATHSPWLIPIVTAIALGGGVLYLLISYWF